ncbi:MAG: PAS domain-containing protein [Arenibacter latericius]|nr:PAS domain-containing protein [Arenibacter latericius]
MKSTYKKLILSNNIEQEIKLLASLLVNVPRTSVTLLEPTKQVFKDSNHRSEPTTLLEFILSIYPSTSNKDIKDILVIENSHNDVRTKEFCKKNPGSHPALIILTPLYSSSGKDIGLLCITDTKTKVLDHKKREGIKALGNLTATLKNNDLEKAHHFRTKPYIPIEDFSKTGNIEENNTHYWRLEIKTNKLYINPRFFQILGYTSSDRTIKSLDHWKELIHPSDRLKFRSELQSWILNLSTYKEVEFRMMHKSGQTIWIHLKADSTNQTLDAPFLKGQLFDITPQKNVWGQIDFLSPNLTNVIQAGYDWLSIIDINGNFSYVNTNSGLAMGYTSESLYSKNYFNYVHADDRDQALRNFNKFLNGKPYISKPIRFKHRDGSWRWIEVLLNNLINDPEIQGIAISAREITHKKSLDHKVKSLQYGLRLLFKSSLKPKFFLDRVTFKILEVNDRMVNHSGYSRIELIGMELKKLFPKDGGSKFADADIDYNTPTETINFGVFTLKSKFGKLFQLELTGHQIAFEDRNSILVCCNDVSERELAAHRQKQVERRL